MRPLVLSLALLLGGSSAALALCPSLPDNAESGYTANQTALAVCRQNEIAEQLRLQMQQAELQSQLNQLRLQIRLNSQLSRAQQVLPQLQF